MKLTKYEHACFTIEKNNQILVVDPGEFATDFITPTNVVAIVITHGHADHLDHDQITAIIDKNQDALIIGCEDVTSKIEVFETKTVTSGEHFTVGNFDLEFFGGTHALIHKSIPLVGNLGVLINDLLYYPGDSFTLPSKAVDTLAIPAAAPWMRVGEAMDFLMTVHPRFVFPTHDAILSAEGKAITDSLLGKMAKECGSEYKRIDSPLEI
jgi:L-ascorbate metabolism protein UlaG (beta-lactamase superfamily)